MRCIECGHELRLTREPLTETYRGETFTIEGIERLACDECGEYEIGIKEADALSEAITEAYAKRHGLLAPTEIKKIRKSLKMTQAQFEKLLGVTKPTVSRWENGASQPTATACQLMRVVRDYPLVLPSLGVHVDGTETGVKGNAFSVINGGKPAWSANPQAKADESTFRMRM